MDSISLDMRPAGVRIELRCDPHDDDLEKLHELVGQDITFVPKRSRRKWWKRGGS